MTLKTKLMLTGVGLSLTLTGVASARERGDKPIPQQRQAQLLEQFGEQGIDANGDGVLTRAEVRAFRRGKGLGRTEGAGEDRGGRGLHGPHEGGFGPGGRLGHMLRALDKLQQETPPAWFTLERFPEADVGGDGQLDAGDWRSFAEAHRAKVIEHLITIAPEADADADGELSQAELDALKATHLARVREQVLAHHPDADADSDGVLSDTELEAVAAARRVQILERHPEADSDGDGVLSEDEADMLMFARHRGGRGPEGQKLGRRDCPHGGFPPSPEQILQRHPEADTDGDGTLSDAEVQAFLASCPRGPGHGPSGHGCGSGGPRR